MSLNLKTLELSPKLHHKIILWITIYSVESSHCSSWWLSALNLWAVGYIINCAHFRLCNILCSVEIISIQIWILVVHILAVNGNAVLLTFLRFMLFLYCRDILWMVCQYFLFWQLIRMALTQETLCYRYYKQSTQHSGHHHFEKKVRVGKETANLLQFSCFWEKVVDKNCQNQRK